MKIYIPRDQELVCLCMFVTKRESEGLSESVWQRLTTAAVFTLSGTGEGHTEQN